MPIYKKNDLPGDRWLPTLLGLRLRQIEQGFDSYGAFADKTGLSRGTLYHLRSGHSNPTFKTIGTLAGSLDMPVWSLLGLREREVRKSLESFGLPYDELAEQLDQEQKSALIIEALLKK